MRREGLPSRDWADMSWRDFAAADTARWIAVLPIAAIEQHGPHLPVGVDAYIASGYLARVRTLLPPQVPATFLPMLAIGVSTEHRSFPGTLTLSPPTLLNLLTEIGESVHRAGVRKIVIVNSHGGNGAVIGLAVRELRVRFRMLAVACSWSRFGYPQDLFAEDERRHGIHGGDVETSIILASRPETVQMQQAGNFLPFSVELEREFKWLSTDRPAGFGWAMEDLHRAGAAGNAAAASAAKGEKALAFGAEALVELLGEVDRFDPARLQEGPL
jgi:creatinine amidohydrolase